MAIAKNPIVFSDYFKIDKTLLKQQNIFDPVIEMPPSDGHLK